MYEVGEMISKIINIIWLAVIARWVGKAVIRFLKYEKKLLMGEGHTKRLMHVRRNLAIYLLIWLEFIVAADIIDTMLNLDKSKLLILGGLIVIRIIVGYSLDKEIEQYEDMKKERDKETL